MLSSEEAERRLRAYREAVREPLSDAARAARAGKLGPAIVTLGRRRATNPDEVGRTIDAMTAARRARLLAYITPEIDEEVGRWWTWAVSRPYQTGWLRRGFRSPDPADSAMARFGQLTAYSVGARTYRQPLTWFASWAGHLRDGHAFSELLASAIDAGDHDVRERLVDQAFGRDEIGGMGRHVVLALLAARDPDGWSAIERLLRSAQRQEGLRQTIFESLDVAHPEALTHVLGVALEERMTRFSSLVRAAGVWFGEQLEARQERRVAVHLAAWRAMLVEPPEAEELLRREAVEAFLGLHAHAVHDVRRAVAVGAHLLSAAAEEHAGHRLAAARVLTEIRLQVAADALVPAFADADHRVVATAVSAFPLHDLARASGVTLPAAAIPLLLDRLDGLGSSQVVETGFLGSRRVKLGAGEVADAMLGASTPETEHLLEPAYARLSAEGRRVRVRRLAQDPVTHRAALFRHLGDTADQPRSTAFRALRDTAEITGDEAVFLEDLLRRKNSAVRRMSLELLGRQPGAAVAASAERLRAGTAEQKRAADELVPPEVETSVARDEIPAILLPDPARRTPAVRPYRGDAPPDLAAGCARVVTSLVAWFDEHAHTEVMVGREAQLLSSIRWLPASRGNDGPALPELWQPWWERVGPTLTDGGLELLMIRELRPRRHLKGEPALRSSVVGDLPDPAVFGGNSGLHWSLIDALAVHWLRPTWVDPLLRATRELLVRLDVSTVHAPLAVHELRGQDVEVDRYGHRRDLDPRRAVRALDSAIWSEFWRRGMLDDEQLAEAFRLLRFVDEPEGTFDPRHGSTVMAPPRDGIWPPVDHPRAIPVQPYRVPPATELVFAAFDRGIASEDDVVDLLLRDTVERIGYFGRSALAEATRRTPPEWARHPRVVSLVDGVRDALLEVESGRGDLPTPFSDSVGAIGTVYGVGWLVRLVGALGTRPFVRGYSWTHSRESVLSRLVQRTFPASGDTDEAVAAALTALRPKRLLEVAVYAPQWAGHVERVLEWDGLESGVWWLHAHTKDESWSVSAEVRQEWNAAVSQRTPLDHTDLVRGAADVAWFHEVLATLGDERFDALFAAARYASSSGGHKRAELFAGALRGLVTEGELVGRITGKRHQDSVRALGLVPLQDDDAVLRRYELLRRFVATDKSSGSQRRASEASAVSVGMENLARTAGFRDPQRLVWAMEAEAVRDLADGPLVARDDDLTVTLTLSADGTPDLEVRRGDRTLKSVPAKAGRTPEIAALRTRVTTLRQQASRMRASLEASCVSGERFERGDLGDLLAHPMIAPMLHQLVLVSDEGVLGFAADPDHVRDASGEAQGLDGSAVRIAHPVDLLRSGSWPDLQHALFADRRTQPFRQVFRELYVPTAGEVDHEVSRRYAGHQVQARIAGGIFGSRGWVADFETGFVKTLHAEKVTVWCSLLGAWGTPGEVEDATIDEIRFHHTGKPGRIPLAEVPPRIFSEVMRDLDLVVSVAHASGVDPETSESSVELRRRLVEETAALLGLDNVTTTDHHAEIRGRRASYSVHLGSGTVHRVPGHAVCIVPVSAQHRGRVFLPFADDDPRTAEVIAKVALLARDHEITDPTILEQLRAPG